MGTIAAVVSKKNKNVAETVVAMLKILKHKREAAIGIASPTLVKTEKSIRFLRNHKISSPIVVGYVLSKILASDKPQPIKLENAALVFDGKIYLTNTKHADVRFIAEKLSQNREKNAEILIKNFDGNFAFVVAESERLMAGRDSLGTRPLYYGETADLAALASERKALWKIGVREPCSFPPGHIATVNKHGFKFKTVKTFAYARTRRITMQAAAEKLQKFLQQSVKQRISGLTEVAVAFSGGLDSSIIAFLTKNLGVEAHLISVSLKNQREIEFAKEAAEALKLPLHIHFYSEKDVKETIPKVLWLIEEPNPIKTSIGIPLFWTAEKASRKGIKVMLTGQGADELFGGYRRYLNYYSQHGTKFVQKMLFNDIATIHETNFERDYKICNFHNVELRLPFATYPLAKFALSLPLQLKIKSFGDMLRKAVLRKMAENIGLPYFIVNKPKRAIQYATGVNRTIKKLAKQKGFSTKEYLTEVFQTAIKKML